jgi:hypothetical protein
MRRDLLNYQSGSIGSSGEVQDYSYYDTITLAAGTLTQRMFQSALGVGGKTLDKTNMKVGGQLPQGERLTAARLKVFYHANAAISEVGAQDILAMFFNTTAEIILANKDMGVWTLAEILGDALLTVLKPVTAGDNIVTATSRFHGIFPFNTPIVLAALTPFEVRITHQTAVTTYLASHQLRLSFNGCLERML